MTRAALRRIVRLFALTLAVVPTATAQGIPGFAAARVTAERSLERRLQEIPDTASARRHAETLASVPHVAGTPAQLATAEHVLRAMASYGLDTVRATYKVWLPYPTQTVIERIGSTRVSLDLDEPAIPSDPVTALPRWQAMNGTTGTGDVTAAVVYVNYGLIEDYRRLDSLGISVRGKVALARYGRSFRGIKAREAEARGAAALILYSDPKDDGFTRGAVYPEGPWRNAHGVQRGSVFNGTGDPSTPGWASLPDARRLAESKLAIARIPVVPISYGNAELFLKEMGGKAAPADWQGGLAFPYHLGDAKVRAHVVLRAERGERAWKTIVNTFGILRGSEFPSEMVIVGGHRDAWGPGAADNVSGVTSILEAARAWATVTKEGTRPRRTLVFATWDAEEWGLVGSTEWVEQMEDSLRLNAVAYINQDMSAWGRSFGASGTTSLGGLLHDATRTVAQPGDTASIYDVWLRASSTNGKVAAPPIGDLGGGSDFTGFYNHLGIPSIEFAFGGSGGVYHSAYDTPAFMQKFGDTGYLAHATAGRLTAVLMARLAQSDIPSFDYHAMADQLKVLVRRTLPDTTDRGVTLLRAKIEFLSNASTVLSAYRDQALAQNVPVDLARVNQALRSVERMLVRPEGLRGRPFMRSLIFAADRDNGYANVALPGIAEAMRDKDAARTEWEVFELADRIGKAGTAVFEAAGMLRAAIAAAGTR